MTTHIQKLINSFRKRPGLALAEEQHKCSYQDLYSKIEKHKIEIESKFGSNVNEVIGLQAEFSIDAIALFLAHLSLDNRVALISPSVRDLKLYAEQAWISRIHTAPNFQKPLTFSSTNPATDNAFLSDLKERSAPGFVIFSSGSTGKPKAVLHDLNRFLNSFENARKKMDTIAFLLFDHIAGIDTLFYTLSSGGSLLMPRDRSPVSVCSMIENHRAGVLPVSPSFIRLLYISGEYRNYDLSTVQIVTFGSEPMSKSGLESAHEMFPRAKIVQKYGTSEFGSPRSQSRSDDALWIKLDSDNFHTKIVNSTLWIKSSTSMLGYLNHKQPEIVDGWLNTEDKVVQDGEWIKILGRESDIINVGGEKVFPLEIENVIGELEFVEDVAAYGMPHALVGNQLCVKINVEKLPSDRVEKRALIKRIRAHCLEYLEPHKVPSKIELTIDSLTNERQKKIRK